MLIHHPVVADAAAEGCGPVWARLQHSNCRPASPGIVGSAAAAAVVAVPPHRDVLAAGIARKLLVVLGVGLQRRGRREAR